MEYFFVAFRSRAHTIKFYDLLKENGLTAQIINTPKEVGVGCGLSVQVSKMQIDIVKNAVKRVNFSSYAGTFWVVVRGGKKIIRSL